MVRTYDIINAGPKNRFLASGRIVSNSGRLLQVQNLPQNKLPDLGAARALVRAGEFEAVEMLYDSISTTLSELIRTAIIPEPSCKLIVADFSAIEARVIAWFAKEQWRLDVFATHGKIYEASASAMFHVPLEEITHDHPLRAKGKIAELALGYGGSSKALETMGALGMGLSEDELPDIVKRWRKANRHIVSWWYSLENAAFNALSDASGLDEIGGIRFRFTNNHLFMDLPSVRSLCYYNARIGRNRFGNPSIHYEGMNQVTRRWEVTDTYGGKLAENATQATARDCLRDAMLRLDEAGYDIRMHVHDEVIINEPQAGRTYKDVCEIMGRPIDWAPKLILRADGFETEYYRKD